jgi:tRNA threonylcarbamoyladenosine biosynthesis protein TsaE
MIDGRKSLSLETRSQSEAETNDIGFEIGCRIDRAVCICLVGSLGSGKSVMARGICRGLGVREVVVSPSFILCEEYEGRIPIIHVDLYRLEHESEVEELGLYDRMTKSVVLAEWGDRSAFLFESSDIIVQMDVTGDTGRMIRVDYDEAFLSILGGIIGEVPPR